MEEKIIEEMLPSLIGGGNVEQFVQRIDVDKWVQHEIDLIDNGYSSIEAVMAGVSAFEEFAKKMKERCKDGLLDALEKHPEWSNKKEVQLLGWKFKNNGKSSTYDYANTGFVRYIETKEKLAKVIEEQVEPLKEEIKAMEELMKKIDPIKFPDGFADPNTGEIFYAPIKDEKPKQPTISKL